MVRTRFVGHLRDVRRLVVAMSRARLGLYVFCRRSLFKQCYELEPTFQLLLQRPDRLGLNLTEVASYLECLVENSEPIHLVSNVDEMTTICHQLYQVRFMAYSEQAVAQSDGAFEEAPNDEEMSIVENEESNMEVDTKIEESRTNGLAVDDNHPDDDDSNSDETKTES